MAAAGNAICKISRFTLRLIASTLLPKGCIRNAAAQAECAHLVRYSTGTVASL